MKAIFQILAGALALFFAAPYTRAETISNPATHHERITAAGAGTVLNDSRNIVVVENPARPPSSGLGAEENRKLASAAGSNATGTASNALNDSLCMLDPKPASITREVDQITRSLSRKGPLPKELVERWLKGCSFDEAKSKLTEAGFKVGEYNKLAASAKERGLLRLADGERAVLTYADKDSASPAVNQPIAALIARITLKQFAGHDLEADGYIYIDGP